MAVGMRLVFWPRGIDRRAGVVLALLALGMPAGPSAARAAAAEIPVPDVVRVESGAFVYGSDRAEREAAYRLDEAGYGHSYTRKHEWYENEPDRGEATLSAFEITRTPITNAQYAAFLADTGHRAPDVDAETWQGYRLIHPYERTRKFAWAGGRLPPGREAHPVVMVSIEDARAYAQWLSAKTARRWRLPTEREWEKAARGTDGRRFPWGDGFDPAQLNSHDAGPFDTLPVGRFPGAASPFGLLDAAGQVFEWTSTESRPGRYIVKGGSWDDKGCGVCRPAARHSRPQAIKHILVGIRLVREFDGR